MVMLGLDFNPEGRHIFRSFFNPESVIGRVMDIVILSVIWLVCCLPVVTIGQLRRRCIIAAPSAWPLPEFSLCFSAEFENWRRSDGVFLLLAMVAKSGDSGFHGCLYFSAAVPVHLCCGWTVVQQPAADVPSFPRVVAAGALTVTAVVVTVCFWYYGVMLLTPALCALLSTFLLEPVWKYTPVEELEEGVEPPWYLQ